MKTTTIYTCEICNTDYEQKDAAENCEKQVVIKEEWQKIGEEKGFYGFGDTGVIGPKKLHKTLTLGRDHKPIYNGIYLYCYQENNCVSLDKLHPYKGWNFLRYVEKKDLEGELKKWKIACEHYKISPSLPPESIVNCDWYDNFVWKFYKEDSQFEVLEKEALEFFEKIMSQK